MIHLLLALLSCQGRPPIPPPPESGPNPRCQTERQSDAEVFKIDDDIYMVRAIGKGAVPNKLITFVVTKEGVVAFDAGTPSSAEISKRILREITDLPIKYIIFSHHHGTNIQGSETLMDPETLFVAHEFFPKDVAWTQDLLQFNRRLNNIQFDLNVPEDKPMEVPPRTDITYADRMDLVVGGVKFELHHVEGEARDYTVLWMPERKVAWIGDLATPFFPMVASPMKPVRHPLMWKEALDHVIALDPDILVNDVNPPFCDKSKIAPFLQQQSDLLQWLHDTVVENMNAGVDVDTALRRIKLPEEFRSLRQGYGSLEFSIRGIYHLYSGWFDMNASSLRPPLRKDIATRFVASMGGADAVLEDATAALGEGRRDVALQYLDLVIDSSGDKRAYSMKAEILAALSEQPSPNGVLKSMYRKLSKVAAMKGGVAPPPTKGGKAKAKAGKAKAGKAADEGAE